VALALTIYLFALTPIDTLAVSYNVRRVLSGDTAASMQIGVQPFDMEGILALPPLLESQDTVIREGVKALLAQRWDQLQTRRERCRRLGWTSRQLVDQLALKRLGRLQHHWRDYRDPVAQEQALERFYAYAYQWY